LIEILDRILDKGVCFESDSRIVRIVGTTEQSIPWADRLKELSWSESPDDDPPPAAAATMSAATSQIRTNVRGKFVKPEEEKNR
jgi:hypothetical protein